MSNQYLQPGTTLQNGKYRIVRFISSGGFGCTYEAIQTLFNSRVAIKEFFVKDFCNRDDATGNISVATDSKKELIGKLKKKFSEEARALFNMRHDGIVRVIDIFEENGTVYYVMDYINGRSLHDIVKEGGPLPEKEAIWYILQVCKALEYVHAHNILHLDIKPGNIMIDQNGKAILIDFGASKHYSEENGENTTTLMGVNTVGYAPVEQTSLTFTTFNPATDIYALGATLYKLLSGITPPEASLLSGNLATLKPLPKNISANTRKVITKAMQIKREDRYQTVKAFADALQGKSQPVDDGSENTSFAGLGKSGNGNKQTKKVNGGGSVRDTRRKVMNRLIIVLLVLVAIVVGVVCILEKFGKTSSGPVADSDSIAEMVDTDTTAEDSMPADTAVIPCDSPIVETVKAVPPAKRETREYYGSYDSYDSDYVYGDTAI